MYHTPLVEDDPATIVLGHAIAYGHEQMVISVGYTIQVGRIIRTPRHYTRCIPKECHEARPNFKSSAGFVTAQMRDECKC